MILLFLSIKASNSSCVFIITVILYINYIPSFTIIPVDGIMGLGGIYSIG